MKIKLFWGWLFFLLNISVIADAKKVDLNPSYAKIIIYDSTLYAPVGRIRYEITPDYIVKYARLTCIEKNNVTQCKPNGHDSKYSGNNDFFNSIPQRFLTEDNYYHMQEYDGPGYKVLVCANAINCNLFSSNTPDRKDKDVAHFLDKINQLLTGKSKYQFKPLIMDK